MVGVVCGSVSVGVVSGGAVSVVVSVSGGAVSVVVVFVCSQLVAALVHQVEEVIEAALQRVPHVRVHPPRKRVDDLVDVGHVVAPRAVPDGVEARAHASLADPAGLSNPAVAGDRTPWPPGSASPPSPRRIPRPAPRGRGRWRLWPGPSLAPAYSRLASSERQPGLLDRPGRLLDRILHPPPLGRPPLGVEEEPGRPAVAVPRLARAAGIEQPLARRTRRARCPPGPGSRTTCPVPLPWNQSATWEWPDRAHAGLHDLHALAGLPLGEHVLPDRVARAGVEQADLAAVGGGRQPGEELERLRGDVLPGPPRGLRGVVEKSEMSIAPVTTRSWLPARTRSHRSRASATQPSGSAPYPTRSPRHQVSSTPVVSTSSSTARSAGRLPWTSESRAMRIRSLLQ